MKHVMTEMKHRVLFSYFAPVLNYLRHGKLILDVGISAEGVLEEAEFYNLTPLISLVKEHIQRRDQQTFTDNKQRVYRVLQCQENELSSVSRICPRSYQHDIHLIVDGFPNERRLAFRAAHKHRHTISVRQR